MGNLLVGKPCGNEGGDLSLTPRELAKALGAGVLVHPDHDHRMAEYRRRLKIDGYSRSDWWILCQTRDLFQRHAGSIRAIHECDDLAQAGQRVVIQ